MQVQVQDLHRDKRHLLLQRLGIAKKQTYQEDFCHCHTTLAGEPVATTKLR